MGSLDLNLGVSVSSVLAKFSFKFLTSIRRSGCCLIETLLINARIFWKVRIVCVVNLFKIICHKKHD